MTEHDLVRRRLPSGGAGRRQPRRVAPTRTVVMLAVALLLVAPAPLVAPAAADELPVDSPLRFEGDGDTRFELDDGRHLLDTVELRTRGARGPVLVNELGMDAYLLGVDEMPGRWPLEALKAQAVAARTYAWHVMRRGSYDGYDVCATVACQVFRGADRLLDGDERWRAAVEATSDEVLIDDDGAPILARYFSTSGGHTYDNEEVFPADGPRPYLVGREDPYDVVSPLHRWEVEFTRDEFDDVLARGDTLAAATPVAEVERLGDVRDQGADLRVTGRDGTEVVVSARAFRDFVSRVAPERHPERFPTLRPDGVRRLPSTLPSTRFTVEVGEDAVVVSGQGWGHGVGMGQYGARARADAGDRYDEILAAYYGGLRPVTRDDVPERIRVGLDLEEDGVGVRPDGVVRIVAGDEVVADRALGRWRAVPEGDGWRLEPPEGHGRALEVSDTRRAIGLDDLADAVVVEAEVNKPARLRLLVTDATGGTVVERDLGVADAGVHAATWRMQDADGARVDAGDYRVAILAEDADGQVGGRPMLMTVEAQRRGAPVPGGADGPPRWALVAAGLAGLAVVLGAAVLVGRRRGSAGRRARDRRRLARRGAGRTPGAPGMHRPGSRVPTDP